MSLIVFGSLNLDLVARSPRLPLPGETILGEGFEMLPGGKGANQAVAAARLGAPTAMVGRVGRDAFGDRLRRALDADGVQTQGVAIDDEHPTGIALITVAQSGENTIVVVPGANGAIAPSDLDHLAALLPGAKGLLLQLEIPLPAVVAAAQRARAAGVWIVLDPAPVPAAFPAELYTAVDILTPNQPEAEQLLGAPIPTLADAQAAACALRDRGVKTAIITLGDRGVVYATAQQTGHQPAFAVPVVDTVAAGDAFNGGLAVALSEGQPLAAAIAWASATAAIAVTQPGAQPSLPSRSQVEAFLATQGRPH